MESICDVLNGPLKMTALLSSSVLKAEKMKFLATLAFFVTPF